MLAPIIHILPLTTIRRERVLPVAGRIMVRKGQRVNPRDVVAEADLAPQHLMLDIARGLGLSPQAADEYIQRKSGDVLSEGDLIAGPIGWAKRVVRTPRAGKVILAGRGKILLEVDSWAFELRAAYPGIVSSFIPERGVVLETYGALIQGVWGNGAMDTGLLRVLISKPEDVLTAEQVQVELRGAVILGGYCGEISVLQNAAGLPVRGLILASMAASLLDEAAKMPYPIVVLEGFGLLPMNAASFKLLTSHDQREVAMNAESFDPYGTSRPEVVIPLPVSDPPAEPRSATIFAPGQRVRIVRAPYHAHTATILTIRPGLDTLPSGVRTETAEVRLENDVSVILPLANLEVLE